MKTGGISLLGVISFSIQKHFTIDTYLCIIAVYQFYH